jgi:hypothetical protein
MRTLGIVAVALTASAAGAQVTLPGAGGGTTTLLSSGSAFTVEVAESKLGLGYRMEFRKRKDCNTVPIEEQDACIRKSMGLDSAGRSYVEGNVALAAEKGKRSLLTGGELTPGVEAALALGFILERAGGGYYNPYVSLSTSARALDVAEPSAGVPNTYVLGSDTETTLALGGGINVFPRENWGIGLSLRAQRAWSSPGSARPKQVCTQRASGVDTSGVPVSIADCQNRYIAPLGTVESLDPRIEALYNFNRRSGAESLGLVGSLSAKLREDGHPAWNAAFGPVLHPAGAPHKIRAAVLVMAEDFTDSGEQSLELKDIVSVRLFVAIPLTGF